MKTLCGWYSESGCPSQGQQLPWPHPGLICETSSVGHGPDTVAASAQHWEKSDMLKSVFLGHTEMKIINYKETLVSTCLIKVY